MPKEVCVPWSGAANKRIRRKFRILPARKIYADFQALKIMAGNLYRDPCRREIIEKAVCNTIFEWPWFYVGYIPKLLNHAMVLALPKWAKDTVIRTLKEIEAGEIVNVWKPGYYPQTDAFV